MVTPESLVESREFREPVALLASAAAEATLVGPEHETPLEIRIRQAEAELDIHTPVERAMESTLAIDYGFLRAAIVQGQSRPERLFGDTAWLAHLKARLLCREYGSRPLTTEFVLAVHQCYLNEIWPGESSRIIDGSAGRGVQFVNGVAGPLHLTDAQVAAINGNPLLRFVPQGSTQQTLGYIEYATMSQSERRARLDAICEAYNTNCREGNIDAYTATGLMQRHTVSLHPLWGDFTGRTTRMVMYWGQENADVSPSIPKDIDRDLLLPESEWIGEVAAGGERYTQYKRRAAEASDPTQLFGLEEATSCYKNMQESGRTPQLFVPGGWYDRAKVEQFLVSVGAPTM